MIEQRMAAVCRKHNWNYRKAEDDFQVFYMFCENESKEKAFTEWYEETLHQEGEEAFAV